MTPSLLLSCDAVSKSYGTRALFEELSFGLFEGDQVGLVGPNGSGKSTLLEILAGLTSPDHGTRSVRGGIRIGYVPQDPVLEPGLTVEAIVASTLTGVDEGDRPGRIALALGQGGFADGHAAVDTLSGGWRKRLAIARSRRRARCAPHGRADQSPRRRRHSLARKGARGAGARRAPRQPRPLLPGARGHPHDRAEPRLSRRTLPDRRALQRLPRAAGRFPPRPGRL